MGDPRTRRTKLAEISFEQNCALIQNAEIPFNCWLLGSRYLNRLLRTWNPPAGDWAVQRIGADPLLQGCAKLSCSSSHSLFYNSGHCRGDRGQGARDGGLRVAQPGDRHLEAEPNRTVVVVAGDRWQCAAGNLPCATWLSWKVTCYFSKTPISNTCFYITGLRACFSLTDSLVRGSRGSTARRPDTSKALPHFCFEAPEITGMGTKFWAFTRLNHVMSLFYMQ